MDSLMHHANPTAPSVANDIKLKMATAATVKSTSDVLGDFIIRLMQDVNNFNNYTPTTSTYLPTQEKKGQLRKTNLCL